MESEAAIDKIMARTDHFYEMFIALVKESKCPVRESYKEGQKNIASFS